MSDWKNNFSPLNKFLSFFFLFQYLLHVQNEVVQIAKINAGKNKTIHEENKQLKQAIKTKVFCFLFHLLLRTNTSKFFVGLCRCCSIFLIKIYHNFPFGKSTKIQFTRILSRFGKFLSYFFENSVCFFIFRLKKQQNIKKHWKNINTVQFG